MIITDTGEVKVGDILLPGLFKSLEIETDAKVDEVDVKGSSVKPKQATGYEDAKIKLKLRLKDEGTVTILDQLTQIQNVFKKPAQGKPLVLDIFNHHCNARGITKVIFKKLKTQEDNSMNMMDVECEFWEWIPITITAVASSSTVTGTAATAAGSTVSPAFKAYLNKRTVGQQAKAEAADALQGERYKAAYAAHQRQLALKASQVDAKRYEAMAKQAGGRGVIKQAGSPAVDTDKPTYKGRMG